RNILIFIDILFKMSYNILRREKFKMLIRFSFKNFKSFKNENVLDMEATSIKEHEYNVVKKDNINLLKVAAIYGANASGKTNVLQAFDYMKNRVLISDDSKKNSNIDDDNVYTF